MNQIETVAQFAGFTKEKNIGWYDNEMLMPQHIYDVNQDNCFDRLLFNESWDWLMLVIDKIESSSVEGHYFTIHISTEKTEIKNDMFLVVFENEGLSKIENTYNAVVQFIEYYNQQKN